VRVLASEPAAAPQAEPDESGAEPTPAPPERLRTPRIGAPGGSGAGSRRVAPVQSAERRAASRRSAS